MRFICNVVFFLIVAGISSSTTVGADAQSLCTKNGGPEAEGLIKISSETIEACYQSVRKEWQAEARNSENKGHALFAMLCNKVDTLNSCVARPMDVIRSCVGPHQDENPVVVYNIKPLILQFACENRKIVYDGLNGSDHECLASKLQAVKTCASENLVVSENATITVDPLKYARDLLEILTNFKNGLNGRVCSDLQNFEQCSVNVADRCKDQSFTKLLDSLGNFMNNVTKCKSKSDASPGSVVNLLLLIFAVMTMFC